MEAGIRRLSALLRAAAAAVFLIGCANVMLFVLSRAQARVRAGPALHDAESVHVGR